MFARWRALVPTPEQIRQNRWLRWLGPVLNHPELWCWNRHGVALGVSLGIFFGFLIPVAQIPLSVGASVVLRANVPMAVASTLVSNPITFAPIYYAAWKVGQRITGQPTASPATAPPLGPSKAQSTDGDDAKWRDRLRRVGIPLITGLSIFACLGGLLAYTLISLIWWLSGLWKKRRTAQ